MTSHYFRLSRRALRTRAHIFSPRHLPQSPFHRRLAVAEHSNLCRMYTRARSLSVRRSRLCPHTRSSPTAVCSARPYTS